MTRKQPNSSGNFRTELPRAGILRPRPRLGQWDILRLRLERSNQRFLPGSPRLARRRADAKVEQSWCWSVAEWLGGPLYPRAQSQGSTTCCVSAAGGKDCECPRFVEAQLARLAECQIAGA